MSCLVQYRYGHFIPLYVVGFHGFPPENPVKWLEKFNRRLEPSVYGTFTSPEARVMQLFHLAVEGKMILIFLQEYLRQKCRSAIPLYIGNSGMATISTPFLPTDGTLK